MTELVIELPCLGRLFRPGMLYDSRSDNLIPNTSLWDSDSLQDAINSKPQIESTYSVIEEDNIDSKCRHLGITPGLKLSMLSGLAKSIKGSASFFHDLSNLARVCVMFKHTTKLEEFSLEEIGEVQYPHIIEEHSNVATHVVTGVLYGVDGIIVFDRVVGDNEKHHEVHGSMLEIVEGLVDSKDTSSIGHLNDSGKYRCKFYGDFPIPKNLTTFQDALEVFSQLHSLSENSRPVPMVVYLSPLTKIDHQYTPVIQQISDDLNMQVQGVIENLSQCEMQVNDILDKHKVFLSNFENLHDHLLQFKKLLSRYKKDFMKQVAMSLPKIRMESATEDSLAKVFHNTEARASPYNSSSLTSWLKQKEEEIKKLKVQVQSVENYQFFSSTRELDCFFEDEDCQYVVCLAFNLVQQDDQYLRRMQSNQRTQTLRQSTTPPSQWYKNAPLMKTLKQCIKQFKSFAEANSRSECVKFAVVGSIQDEEFSENQGVILLYEASVPRIWVPPGPPGKPLISDVTHNSVQVTLQKPEYGDTSVTSYTVLYSSVKDSRLGKWKQVPMIDPESVVVTKLIPEEEYVFKICPECEAGQGPESESSDPIETKSADSVQQIESWNASKVVTRPLESKPKNQLTKPIPTRVTHDTIELKWTQPTVEGGSISFYIVYYRCVDSSNDWKNQPTASPQPRATMSGLVSGGGYEFKFQPFTSSGPGSESEVSDVIKTKATSPPGKPTASNVTQDSVELNWKAPDYGLQNIEHYTVSYQALGDPSREWKTLYTKDVREKITVTGLSAQTKYIFKVIPQCKSDTGCDSETSHPIETKANKSKPLNQPTKPVPTRVTHDTVELKWTQPTVESGSISFYIVYYRCVDSSNDWKNQATSSSQSQATMSGLVSGGRYEFKVQSFTSSGPGSESELSDVIKTKATSPPGKPIATDVTQDSIKLNWTVPDYGIQNIEHYTVSYQALNNSSKKWQTIETRDASNKITVTGLSVQTKYTFMVTPNCKSGTGCDSEISDPIETKPKESAKSSKPVPTRVTHNAIELEWTQSTLKKESISFYIVYYRCTDPANSWKQQPTRSSEPQASVQNLVSGSGYEFKVQPFIGSGPGSESEVSDVIKTKATSPSGKPTASVVTQDSVELNWKAPDYGVQNIEHYTVSYQALDDPSREWKTLNTRDIREKITVTELSAQTKYIFKVIPQCKSGTGCESESSDPIETKCKIVCQPGKPESYNVTHDTVQLRWSKPAHNSENIQFYIVSYGTVGDHPDQYKAFATDGCKEFAEVNALTPGTKYVFTVQPTCTNSDSLSCMQSKCSDPIQTLCTSKPGKPECTVISNSFIKLQWSQPSFVAEPILSYIVSIDDPQNQTRDVCTVQGNHNEAVINKLETNKKYIFKVRAKCQSGDGAMSDSSDPVCTNATSPPGKPNASVVLHDSIQVTWTKPTHGSENIINYTLLYRQVNASPDEWIEEQTVDSEEHFTLENLELATSYVFKIRPECGIAANGTESDISNPIKTKSTSEPSVPRASTVTCDSVVLEWEKPEIGHENIQYYTIISSSDPSLKWKKLPATVDPYLQLHCTGLTPNRSYTFSVCPMCKDGSGTESISQPIQTKSYCKPGKPQASLITHNGLKLEWAKPEYGSDNVQSYNVYYHRADDPSPKSKPLNGKYSKESVITTKLDPQTSYIFKVYPQLKKGAGSCSESDDSDPIETLATSPPGKPSLINVTHESVQLKWNKPSVGHNSIKSYTVLYHPIQCSSDDLWEKEEDISQRTATVSGLDTKTKYFFKVLAVCEYGVGACSEQIEAETKQACKPGKPEVSSVSHEAVWLKWSKPEHGSSTVKSYIVLYRQTGDMQEEWIQVQTSRTNNNFCVAKLIPAISYEFKVFPECRGGIGADSDVSDEVMTLATSPPGKPVPTSVTHDSIEIKWAKPRVGSQNIESYTVFYINSESNESNWEEVSVGLEESAEITDLNPDTGYLVKVRPDCSAGNGDFSPTSDCIKTKPPCRPGTPMFVSSTHDSIQLKWERPTYDSDIVDFYSLSYKSMDDLQDNWTFASTNFQDLLAEVDGLQPDTGYVFRVFPESHSDIIPGAVFSDNSDIIKTKSTSKPGTPEASIITHNSIKLQWTPPDYGYENIKCYSIIYGVNGDKQLIVKTTNAKQEKVEVKALTLNTTYEFKIRPECKHGVGCESESNTFTTRATSKPGKPRETGAYYNGIVLEWEAPMHGSQYVENYTVYYRKDNAPNDDWNSATASVTMQGGRKCSSAQVIGLASATKYLFKVHSECIFGEGDDSDTSDPIGTTISSRPDKPTVSEGKITHETICVEWNKPTFGYENIRCYSVLYRAQHEKETEWKIVQTSDDTRTSMVVGGLRTKTKYIFKVRPVYPAGSGAESEESDPIETKVTSPPSKPVCIDATHNSLELQWEKPKYGGDKVKSYVLKYRAANSSQMEWKSVKVLGAAENFTVKGLSAKTAHVFKVCPVCNSGTGTESEVSDTMSTLSSCKPGTPKSIEITHESMELEWEIPADGADSITSYTVYYCVDEGQNSKWRSLNTEENCDSIIIPNLTEETKYCVKVFPECSRKLKMGIETSDPAYFETEPKPLAEHMRSKSTLINDGPPAIYKVPTRYVMNDKVKRIAKLDVGIPDTNYYPEKVLMVVGQTGAGKTTLINGIANYIFNVRWEDQFRFKLITEETQDNQSKSQTSWITAYTFYPTKGSRIKKYKLTIIDTPGFGDTEGIERDKELVKQIKGFFSIKGLEGIDQIHGIGFVAQSPLARLTPTQKYVFDAILAIYGKDIAGNIFLMITFADGQDPPVLAAVNSAGIPYNDHFKFNNSALFAKQKEKSARRRQRNFDTMFWDMGMDSFDSFFEVFRKAQSQSLQQTREVLDERDHLETLVQGLQVQVNAGLNKMEELRQEEDILKTHEAKLLANEEFEYQIEVTKQRKVDLPIGHHVTNCLICNFTCHEDCMIADDDNKYYCAAMEPKDPDHAHCEICPQHCFWDQHKNNRYKFEIYQEYETKTSDELKERYDTAQGDKTEVEGMITNLKKELEDLQNIVFGMICDTQQSLQRLQEIALKPNPLNEIQYIELLIESEKKEAKPGWKKRMKALEDIKEQAEIIFGVQSKSGKVWTVAGDHHPPKQQSGVSETKKHVLQPEQPSGASETESPALPLEQKSGEAKAKKRGHFWSAFKLGGSKK